MYEYLSETVNVNTRSPGGPQSTQGGLGSRLTALSGEGWELVEIISQAPRPMVLIVMRREVS